MFLEGPKLQMGSPLADLPNVDSLCSRLSTYILCTINLVFRTQEACYRVGPSDAMRDPE